MKSFMLAVLGLSVVTLASAGCAYTTSASSETKMSAADERMMASCMSMSHDDMMKNRGCTGMMAKMNMTESDMQMAASCMKMSHDAMGKDHDCTSMMKMHPGMMKMNMPK